MHEDLLIWCVTGALLSRARVAKQQLIRRSYMLYGPLFRLLVISETTAKKLLLSQAVPTAATASTQSGRGGQFGGKMRSSDLQLSRTLLIMTR